MTQIERLLPMLEPAVLRGVYWLSNTAPAPKTILVADDDLAVLSVIKRMLEREDYNVLLAHSGEATLRMAKRADLTIDLMLLDAELPDISGPDLAERSLSIRPHVKLLFTSGCPDSEISRAKIIDRGFGLLLKPFTLDTLLERVQNAFSYTGGPPSDEGGGTSGEGCAEVVSPPLPSRPRRPPMTGKVPLPE
jgi:DNA-binding response OmpR family regulator